MQTEALILKILLSSFSDQFKSDPTHFNETLIKKELGKTKKYLDAFEKKNYVSSNIPEIRRTVSNGLLVVLIYYLRHLNIKVSDTLLGDTDSIEVEALKDYYSLIERLEFAKINSNMANSL